MLRIASTVPTNLHHIGVDNSWAALPSECHWQVGATGGLPPVERDLGSRVARAAGVRYLARVNGREVERLSGEINRVQLRPLQNVKKHGFSCQRGQNWYTKSPVKTTKL
jgi:hypothetical protein